MSRTVYLDWNASCPLRPEATAAAKAALDDVGNPSSIHAFGRSARYTVERARRAVARLVGASPPEVVFTGGATEANALALASCDSRRGSVWASAIEHHSVLDWSLKERLPITADGVLDLPALEQRLSTEPLPRLLSVMAVNNETGAVQPVAEAAAIARRFDVPVHCDAVQAAGRLAIDMTALQVDYLSLSAHKMGGPQGVGALIVRDGISVVPLLKGGGQERRRRAGTENVAGIAGFGAAAAVAATDGLAEQSRLALLRDRLEAGIRTASPGASIFASAAPRVANTSCVAMPGVSAETQVMAFDMAGIAVSAGAACSSGKVTTSHVLEAMGVPAEEAARAIRVSLGWTTTTDDIDRFLAVWQEICGRVGQPARIAAV